MKVLFAVSSESISDAIIKRYQKEYKEILSYKNVYYFNAILKEIQKDKSYDRIVISEDLEPFSNNNYDAIDKFIFEKLDNISDEAHDSQGKETSIILICTDRHTKGSSFLVKLFGIGVYNALLGNDRSMEQVCKLINQPRVKKEAKMYYKVDSDDVNYDPSSEKEVSELEIQNILNHFKKIAKNKDKYADSFNNIAAQYTDEQLKIIVNCLPISVKAVLEEECQKYQELMSASMIQRVGGKATIQAKKEQEATGIKIDILENKLTQPKMSGPIVIPSSVKTAGSKGPVRVKKVDNTENKIEPPTERKIVKKVTHNPVVQAEKPRVEEKDFNNLLVDSDIDEIEDEPLIMSVDEYKADDDFSMLLDDEPENDDLTMSFDDEQSDDDFSMLSDDEPENDDITMSFDDEQSDDDFSMLLDDEPEDDSADIEEQMSEASQNKTITIKKGRGRPRKNPVEIEPKAKGKRGRPRKNPVEMASEQAYEEEDSLDLMLDDEFEEDINSADIYFNEDEDDNLLISTDEYEDDTVTMPLDDEQEYNEDDDFTMLLDDEPENDDLTMSFDSEQSDDDFSIELDDESVEEVYPEIENEEDFNVVDTEEGTEEVSLPEIEDLDDIEDYEDNDEEDILSGMDYEEIDENDYLIKEISQQDGDDSFVMTLDDEEEESLIPPPAPSKVNQNTAVSNNFSNNVNDFSSFENEEPILNQSYNNYPNNETSKVESIKPQVDYSMSTLNSLLTKDKKIVTFIGTTKNGTSFLINNLAALFVSIGINTAILDMTQNRNSYYIYTKNEESLRKIAYTSIEKLENGFAEGIKVDKNLTVYTALPNNGKKYTNAESILSTLVQNHSLVLIDCDFETDPSYFANCQEIYLVQSMDILTIQPLTSFLRDLKAKGVLESEKVRVVINKEIKVRSLTTKLIIGGMSFYNDPAMSFMTELFNKDTVKACSIPFEDATYSRYLDAMVNCNVSLNGCSRAFKDKLRILGEMVYPLISKQTYSKPTQNYNRNTFSNNMNNTLNQMKNKF